MGGGKKKKKPGAAKKKKKPVQTNDTEASARRGGELREDGAAALEPEPAQGDGATTEILAPTCVAGPALFSPALSIII